ncbi:helix-turn-helix domain-containing protein, partial [Burkholderia pseudomallei]|uniref:DNA-binding protein n=1 Tax=Burkholderia pseudomallei TaxID=28450 RepID=UPI002932EB50
MKTNAAKDGRDACGAWREDDVHAPRACDARAQARADGEDAAGRAGGDSGCDPALVAVLLRLREAAVDARGAPWSLAKLAKRAGMPMSALRRALTRLDAAGVTETIVREDGTGCAALTAQGRQWCDALFGGAAAARGGDA